MRKALSIVGLGFLLLAFSSYGGTVRAQMGPGMIGPGYGMGPGMMDWGYGMGWFWNIIMVVFWIAVIVGIIFVIRWFVISTGTSGRATKMEDSALEILKKRYARGEIDKEEFEEKKKDIA